MNENLQGVWAFHREAADHEELILQVFPDGRLAQFYQQHSSCSERVCMTMRATREADGAFRIKTIPEAEGYLIELRREGANLVIVNKEKSFVCRPLDQNEMPSWLEAARLRAVWK